FDRELAVDSRPAFTLCDRPAHANELALEREHIAGLDDAFEAATVDTREEGDLPAVRLVGEHARHHRPFGEVPREPPVVGANLTPADDALPRLELDDVVHEQERRPMRDELHDHVAAERRNRCRHATSSSFSLSRARPRCAWHFAVPTGIPAASAISSNE